MSDIVDAGDIRYPPGFGLDNILCWGSFGMICLDEASQTVIKSPHGEDYNKHLDVERRIYERIEARGGHPGFLRYHGLYGETCVRLEYAPKGSLSVVLREASKSPDASQRLRWAVQVTDALSFLHAAGVIHGDLTCNNVFLDADLDAKLADFAGSSLDGSPLLVVVTQSHAYPGDKLSVRGDLFALGSVLYEIVSGSRPCAELPDHTIEELYAKGEFPDTRAFGRTGTIIQDCWLGHYDAAGSVARDLKGTYTRQFWFERTDTD